MKKAVGWFGRLGIALALVFGVALTVAAPASAADVTTLAASVDSSVPATVSATSPTGIVPMADEDEGVDISNLTIPMLRWTGDTQSFNYVTDGNPVGAAARASERTIFYSFPMMLGNTMWMGSSALLEGAIMFKPMKIVGLQIDKAAAGIGQSIIDSPLISLAFIVIALGTIFMLKRGGQESPWKRVWTTSVVAAMFVIMVVGSGNSTEVDGEYKPGMGSPGWFLTSIQDTTATITSTVAASLSIPSFDDGGVRMCDTYVDKVMNPTEDGEEIGKDYPASSIMPMASSLWTQTGLEAWKLAQFGTSSYGEQVWCHVLDWSNPKAASDTLNELGSYPASNPKSAALSPKDGEQRDRSGIAWAVCAYPSADGNWTVAGNFFTDDNGTKKWGQPDTGIGAGVGDPESDYEGTDGHCADWFSGDAADWDSEKFKVGPNASDINVFVDGDDRNKQNVKTFLMNWQGADNSGIAVTLSYSVSSFIISVVFLVVAGAMFFVNIALVAAMLSIFIVMLVVLFTKNDVGTRLGGFIKNIIGLVVFSSVAALLIAMLAKIIEVLGEVGKAIFGDAPLAVMLWVGVSPLLAIIMLHFIFTKLLKVPSPFKLSSALAWGAAAGAAGGAVGAGVGGMISRGENKAENAVKSAPGALARKGKDALFNKGDKRDGAAGIETGKGANRDAIKGDKTGEDVPKTALERRQERKDAKAELATARREAKDGIAAGDKTGEDKNAGYLSKADRLLGGTGEISPATSGWRGAANKIAGITGNDAFLSDRDTSKPGLAGNAMDSAVEGVSAGAKSAWGNLKAVPAQMAANAREKNAQYGELWRENKGAAVRKTLGTTAKYGAIGVATALTGGLAAPAYVAYRGIKSGAVASQNVRQDNNKNALAAYRQRNEQAAPQQPQRRAAPQQSQPQQSQPQPQRQATPQPTRRNPNPTAPPASKPGTKF